MSNAEVISGRMAPRLSAVRPFRPQCAPQRIRVFIGDDHALFRQTLRMGLEAEGGFMVVGEAADGRDAFSAIARTVPEIALVELELPLLNGLELAVRLRRERIATRTVVMASRTQESLLLRMLDCGIAGFLSKEADFQELTLALRKVHAGFCYLTPSLEGRPPARRARSWRGGEAAAPHDLLTIRERELLRLVGEGHSNREIADRLCLSVKTVEAHKANICGKLNVRGSAGLVRHAIQAEMIGIGG